jgi:predicted lipoprotein with Yx(FWY)xxD motif
MRVPGVGEGGVVRMLAASPVRATDADAVRARIAGNRAPWAAFSRWLSRLIPIAAALSTVAAAQPADLPIAPATTTSYPPGIKVVRLPGGAVYANKAGHTLYGLDMRTVLRAGPDPAQYCKGPCAETWEAVLAPAEAKPNIRYPGAPGRSRPDEAKDPAAVKFIDNRTAPDWTIIGGPRGPQWVYKGWHMVFVRKAGRRGTTEFDGADGRIWNVLRYVPPLPVIVAPGNVKPVFVDGAYALADEEGRLLFTGKCKAGCAGWKPFSGGMASAGLGEWRVSSSGDVPQWLFRGAPVFVGPDGHNVTEGGKVLRP